jgi:hypothetical protein
VAISQLTQRSEKFKEAKDIECGVHQHGRDGQTEDTHDDGLSK